MASGIYSAIKSNSVPSTSAKVVQRDLSPCTSRSLRAPMPSRRSVPCVEGIADEIEVHAVLDDLRLQHRAARVRWRYGHRQRR
jgi:hypothetical protein